MPREREEKKRGGRTRGVPFKDISSRREAAEEKAEKQKDGPGEHATSKVKGREWCLQRGAAWSPPLQCTPSPQAARPANTARRPTGMTPLPLPEEEDSFKGEEVTTAEVTSGCEHPCAGDSSKSQGADTARKEACRSHLPPDEDEQPLRDSPGPAVRTRRSHCRGCRFDPRSGN